MRILWKGAPQGLEYIDLTGGVVNMIIAADYVADIHIEIIDYYAEVIGWHSVSTQ